MTLYGVCDLCDNGLLYFDANPLITRGSFYMD